MCSFSPSENELFAVQKAQLISEQQKFQNKIQKVKLRADGCEYNLQVEKVVFSFAESTIIGPMKQNCDYVWCHAEK
jgi:hypothetical protein